MLNEFEKVIYKKIREGIFTEIALCEKIRIKKLITAIIIEFILIALFLFIFNIPSYGYAKI